MGYLYDMALRLTAETADLKKGLNKANSQLTGFQKQVSNINNKMSSTFKTIGGAIAGAFAARALYNFAKEAANLASEFRGVEQAFKRLGNAGENMVALKNATRGTVSELELMKQAIKAENFGIPMETLAAGLEFATKRAAQTGESVDYLVNSFVTGLGRKSVLILDNLGISAIALKEEIAQTGDFMKAVANITNRELSKMGEVMLTDAQKMAQFNTNIQEAKTRFGELVLKGLIPFVDVGNKMYASINSQSKAMEEERVQVNLLVAQLSNAGSTQEQRKKIYEELQKLYPSILKGISQEAIDTKKLYENLREYNSEMSKKIALQGLEEDKQKIIGKQANKLATLSIEQAQALDRLNQGYEEYNKKGKINDDAEKAFAAVRAQIENLNKEPIDQAQWTKNLDAIAVSVGDLTFAFRNGMNIIQSDATNAGQAYRNFLENNADALGELDNTIAYLSGQIKKIEPEELIDGDDAILVLNSIAYLEDEIAKKQETLRNIPVGPDLAKANQEVEALQERLDILKSFGIEADIVWKPKIRIEEDTSSLDDFITQMEADLQAELAGETFEAVLPIEITPDILAQSLEQYDWSKSFVGMEEAANNAWARNELTFTEYQDRLGEIQMEKQAYRNELLQQSAQFAVAIGDFLSNMYEGQMNKELAAAGNNEEQKDKIRAKYAKKQKRIAIIQALIGTALAVVNALQTQPFFPLGLIMAGVAAAAGAAQVAGIASQSFAAGGVVYGPTQALVGEYPGARTNPEVIAPLDKLESIIQNTMGGEVYFTIDGTQLVGVLNNQYVKSESY